MTLARNKMDAPPKRVISFMLPVYNEYGSLQQLYQQITAVMKNRSDDYDLVFVDDGSTDNSFDILRDVQQNDKKVRFIQFRKNFGTSAAYSVGLHHARGDIIMTMDTDLQDDPNDIPLFMNEINAVHDLVVGWRHSRKDSVEKPCRLRYSTRLYPGRQKFRSISHPGKHDHDKIDPQNAPYLNTAYGQIDGCCCLFFGDTITSIKPCGIVFSKCVQDLKSHRQSFRIYFWRL